MSRAGFTVIVLATVLAVGGFAQSSPNVGSSVAAMLRDEWRDLELYPDLDFTTGKPDAAVLTTGGMHCLTALDLYTRSGSSNRKNNSDLALKELILGNQPAEPLYRVVPPSDLPGLLAAGDPGVAKDNKLLAAAVFDLAKKRIDAAFLKGVERLDREVNKPARSGDPFRAFYGLLNLQADDLQKYAKAVAGARQTGQYVAQAVYVRDSRKLAVDTARDDAGRKAANDELTKANDELTKLSALDDQARKDQASARTSAEDALYLMEIYRICYKLDDKKLLKLVTDLFELKRP
jgi:hypothetical protein